MKALLAIVLLLPTWLVAQDITGIWTGTLFTSERHLPYEVVISDSSGTLIGYSHITFNVKGEDVIAVKRLSVTMDDDKITLEDEDIISDNIPDANAKRIKQIANLVLNKDSSGLMLIGAFKAKRMNELKPINGYISLQKKTISDSSKLMTKLNEMDLASSLSFLQLKKQTGKVAAETIADNQPKDNGLAARAVIPPPPVVIQKPPTPVVPKDTVAVAIKQPVVKKIPSPVEPKPKEVKVVAVAPVVQPKPKEIKTVAVAPKVVKTVPVTQPVAKPVVAVAAPPIPKPVVAPPPVVHVNQFAVNTTAASDIAHRQIQNIQTLYITCDSIVVTLYDNGEVDGDTVSILLNGKVIMPREGLSTNPITKTVYVTPDLGDSLQFVMYAENLGSIPPNTGLMILQDGKVRHEIFFSGDLEKNAAITLRKRHDN